MEGLKKKYQNMSLRQSFIYTVFFTFGTVVLLSGLVIWGCVAFQRWLLPESDTVQVIVQAENSEGEIQEYFSCKNPFRGYRADCGKKS